MDLFTQDAYGGCNLARASHPQTSADAAESIVGTLAAAIAFAVRCVRETPGRTRRELAAIHCPEDEGRVGKRLDGACKMGLLRRGEPRRCDVTGRMATTWYPVEDKT